MTLHRATNIALACAIAAIISSAYLLDGPSEIEAAQAVSGEVHSAIKSIAADERYERATARINHETVAMVKP